MSMSPVPFDSQPERSNRGSDETETFHPLPQQKYSVGEETACIVALDHSNLNQAFASESESNTTPEDPPAASSPAKPIPQQTPKEKPAPAKPASANVPRLPVLASPKVFMPQLSPSMYAPIKISSPSPLSPIPRHMMQNMGPQSYALTPPKIAMAKNDSDSDDSGDEKLIPMWARKEHLKQQVVRQHTMNPDPTIIFPIPNTCDLEDMFSELNPSATALRKRRKRPKNFLRQRGSSGYWERDRVTEAEKESFRKKMRYV